MCNSLTRKTKRKCLVNIAKAESNETNKLFWNSVNTFIPNENTVSENFVIKVEADKIMKVKEKHDEISIKTNDVTNEEKVLVEMLTTIT